MRRRTPAHTWYAEGRRAPRGERAALRRRLGRSGGLGAPVRGPGPVGPGPAGPGPAGPGSGVRPTARTCSRGPAP
ncbi:hypothetical protein E0E62_07835 [Streptomyces sp. 16-176A]